MLLDTSGRDDVAKAIASVFPAHRKFVEQFREMFEVPLPSGPTATDQISRKGRRTVLYRTLPEKQGLGTEGWLKPNADPIDGALILLGDAPDLLHVQVRLPANLRHLAPYILRHSESAAR